MAKGDQTLMLVGVVVIAWWLLKTNGMPFRGGFASGEFRGNPTDYTIGTQNAANYQNHVASSGPYSGSVGPTLGGAVHW
jgi:hypothetical protein